MDPPLVVCGIEIHGLRRTTELTVCLHSSKCSRVSRSCFVVTLWYCKFSPIYANNRPSQEISEWGERCFDAEEEKKFLPSKTNLFKLIAALLVVVEVILSHFAVDFKCQLINDGVGAACVFQDVCPAVYDLTDDCSEATQHRLTLDDEAAKLCNRHQLCYSCVSIQKRRFR